MKQKKKISTRTDDALESPVSSSESRKESWEEDLDKFIAAREINQDDIAHYLSRRGSGSSSLHAPDLLTAFDPFETSLENEARQADNLLLCHFLSYLRENRTETILVDYKAKPFYIGDEIGKFFFIRDVMCMANALADGFEPYNAQNGTERVGIFLLGVIESEKKDNSVKLPAPKIQPYDIKEINELLGDDISAYNNLLSTYTRPSVMVNQYLTITLPGYENMGVGFIEVFLAQHEPARWVSGKPPRDLYNAYRDAKKKRDGRGKVTKIEKLDFSLVRMVRVQGMNITDQFSDKLAPNKKLDKLWVQLQGLRRFDSPEYDQIQKLLDLDENFRGVPRILVIGPIGVDSSPPNSCVSDSTQIGNSNSEKKLRTDPVAEINSLIGIRLAEGNDSTHLDSFGKDVVKNVEKNETIVTRYKSALSSVDNGKPFTANSAAEWYGTILSILGYSVVIDFSTQRSVSSRLYDSMKSFGRLTLMYTSSKFEEAHVRGRRQLLDEDTMEKIRHNDVCAWVCAGWAEGPDGEEIAPDPNLDLDVLLGDLLGCFLSEDPLIDGIVRFNAHFILPENPPPDAKERQEWIGAAEIWQRLNYKLYQLVRGPRNSHLSFSQMILLGSHSVVTDTLFPEVPDCKKPGWNKVQISESRKHIARYCIYVDPGRALARFAVSSHSPMLSSVRVNLPTGGLFALDPHFSNTMPGTFFHADSLREVKNWSDEQLIDSFRKFLYGSVYEPFLHELEHRSLISALRRSAMTKYHAQVLKAFKLLRNSESAQYLLLVHEHGAGATTLVRQLALDFALDEKAASAACCLYLKRWDCACDEYVDGLVRKGARVILIIDNVNDNIMSQVLRVEFPPIIVLLVAPIRAVEFPGLVKKLVPDLERIVDISEIGALDNIRHYVDGVAQSASSACNEPRATDRGASLLPHWGLLRLVGRPDLQMDFLKSFMEHANLKELVLFRRIAALQVFGAELDTSLLALLHEVPSAPHFVERAQGQWKSAARIPGLGDLSALVLSGPRPEIPQAPAFASFLASTRWSASEQSDGALLRLGSSIGPLEVFKLITQIVDAKSPPSPNVAGVGLSTSEGVHISESLSQRVVENVCETLNLIFRKVTREAVSHAAHFLRVWIFTSAIESHRDRPTCRTHLSGLTGGPEFSTFVCALHNIAREQAKAEPNLVEFFCDDTHDVIDPVVQCNNNASFRQRARDLYLAADRLYERSLAIEKLNVHALLGRAELICHFVQWLKKKSEFHQEDHFRHLLEEWGNVLADLLSRVDLARIENKPYANEPEARRREAGVVLLFWKAMTGKEMCPDAHVLLKMIQKARSKHMKNKWEPLIGFVIRVRTEKTSLKVERRRVMDPASTFAVNILCDFSHTEDHFEERNVAWVKLTLAQYLAAVGKVNDALKEAEEALNSLKSNDETRCRDVMYAAASVADIARRDLIHMLDSRGWNTKKMRRWEELDMLELYTIEQCLYDYVEKEVCTPAMYNDFLSAALARPYGKQISKGHLKGLGIDININDFRPIDFLIRHVKKWSLLGDDIRARRFLRILKAVDVLSGFGRDTIDIPKNRSRTRGEDLFILVEPSSGNHTTAVLYPLYRCGGSYKNVPAVRKPKSFSGLILNNSNNLKISPLGKRAVEVSTRLSGFHATATTASWWIIFDSDGFARAVPQPYGHGIMGMAAEIKSD